MGSRIQAEPLRGGKNMWLLFAAGSAFFAGVTSILAKCGIKDTDSNVATAVRTVVVLAFSWGMVFLVGSQSQIGGISGKTLIFLILSGLATGASWLCYFHALQIGDVNQVVPVDKSSTVLTILLALIFLGEGISLPKLGALLVITAGIYLMIEKKETPDLLNVTERNGRMEKSEVKITGKAGKIRKSIRNGSWFLYACGSAFFASLTAILGKIGISGVESNLGTAIRTTVVLAMAWLIVLVTGKGQEVKKIQKTELAYICLSGLATGATWLCYYRALKEGPASVVAPVDKLSVLVTVVFSYFVFGEKLKKKATVGLVLLTAGTIAMTRL